MIDSEFSRLLVSQIVQVTLVAAVVWIAVKVFAKNRPHLAHALWLLVLLKCLTPPVWSSPVSPFSWMSAKSAIPIQVAKSDIGSQNNFRELLPPKHPKIVVRMDSQASKTREHEMQPSFTQPELPKPEVSKRLAKTLEPTMAVSRSSPWSGRLVWIWLASGLVALAISVIRFVRFWTWIRKCEVSHCVDLGGAVARVAGKLGLARRVNVRVLNASVGPAVIGLIRPTILLPESIVKGKTESELEPLLAHELNHVRRGDLWWALVQTIARNLFWFHPLVWLADRMVTRESERCCDEETIASLGCSPATYARCLIEVLEQKHQLRVSPALPGVRPVEVTSARLERVMKLGQGSHRRTPTSVWLVMVTCSVVALPGAALIFAQDQETQDQTTNAESGVEHSNGKDEAGKEAEEVGEPLPPSAFYIKDDIQYFPRGPEFKLSREAAALKDRHLRQQEHVAAADQVITKYDSEKEEWVCKSFNVKKILDGIRSENLETRTAEERLILELPCRYPSVSTTGVTSSTPERRNIELSTQHGIVRLGDSNKTISIVRDQLWVYDTKTVVAHVERLLKQIEDTGLHQIVVECRMITMSQDSLADLGIDWSVGQSGPSELVESQNAVVSTQGAIVVSEGTNPMMLAGEVLDFSSLDKDASSVQAASFVEKTSPVIYAFVSDGEIRELAVKSRSMANSNLIQAPTVTMFSGQNAEIMDGSHRPFVVGLKRTAHPDDESLTASQPVIRIVPEGTTVKLNATLLDDRSVDLDCRVKLSQILSVSEAKVPSKDKDQETRIQIPEVAISQIQSSMNIPDGKTLVLGSYRDNDEGEKQAFLVMLTCRPILTENPTSLNSVEQVSDERLGEILGGTNQLPMAVNVLNADGEFEIDLAYSHRRQRALAERLLPAHGIDDAKAKTQTSALKSEGAREYLLDEGDVLGVHIEGVLGERGVAPSVMLPPEGSDLPPSIGSPIPVREGGKIALPLIELIDVKGMTVEQAKQAIKRAYFEGDDPALDEGRIIVTLYRMRESKKARAGGSNSKSNSEEGDRGESTECSERLLLTSEVPANQQTAKEMPTELLQAFRRLDIDVKVLGHVEYTVQDDYVSILGSELSLASISDDMRNGECLMRGERGELRFYRSGSDSMEVRLEGNARLKAGDFSLSADKLIYRTTDRTDDGAIKFNLEGNAVFDNGDFKLSGNSIMIGSESDPETIFVEGNGNLIRTNPKMNISAQRIVWDLNTDEITSSNK